MTRAIDWDHVSEEDVAWLRQANDPRADSVEVERKPRSSRKAD